MFLYIYIFKYTIKYGFIKNHYLLLVMQKDLLQVWGKINSNFKLKQFGHLWT